eukprot:496171-Pelagomonas_calceolata.AAC.1
MTAAAAAAVQGAVPEPVQLAFQGFPFIAAAHLPHGPCNECWKTKVPEVTLHPHAKSFGQQHSGPQKLYTGRIKATVRKELVHKKGADVPRQCYMPGLP